MLKKFPKLTKSRKVLTILALLCFAQAALLAVLRYQKLVSGGEAISQPAQLDRSESHWNEIIDGKYYSKEDLIKQGRPLRKMNPQW